ncbi:MAG: UDP-3-O-acyl-N-acetylglucosamine deacetylase [Holophagaceae bacterium]
MQNSSLSKGRTISRLIRVEGRGVHSDEQCSIMLKPANAATGLRFIHSASSTIVPVDISCLKSTSYATTLYKDGIEIQTVEHLLSALVGLSIFNLDIVLEMPAAIQELPILDGSSKPWVTAILEAGISNLEVSQKTIRIKDPISIVQGDRSIRVEPSSGLIIDYTIDFHKSVIGTQHHRLVLNSESYLSEISSARTFCLESEIKSMKQLGLARGGNLDNAIVFSTDGYLNDFLRYPDEPVRHKVLDLVGDLALLGSPLEGKIIAVGAGHQLHTDLCRTIIQEVHKWELTTLAS